MSETNSQSPPAKPQAPPPRRGFSSRTRPHTVRLGDREIVTHGLKPNAWHDISHRALTASWPKFTAAIAAAFLAINCFFASLYFLAELAGKRAIANVATGAFADYVYFSLETISTVGYGDMHPATHYGHVIAGIEMFVGLFSLALMTGLIFARFTRPLSRVVFANAPIVTPFNGKPTLMIRMANARHNTISNASAKLWMIRNDVSEEGVQMRRFHELPLVRHQNPLFVLSWTVMHAIDGESPMAGLDPAELARIDAGLVLIVSGLDENSSQTLHARQSYAHTHLRFGERYADILSIGADGRPILDYRRLHDTETVPARI